MAWIGGRKVGIGDGSLEHSHQSDVTYVIMHEFQHLYPPAGDEMSATWVAVQYGKQTGIHPYLINAYKARAIAGGYTQAKWDAGHVGTIYGNRK